jgi:hypothetical protein
VRVPAALGLHAELRHHREGHVDVGAAHEAVDGQLERRVPERRRHEQGGDELARGAAGQPQTAARQATSLQRERQALGVPRLGPRALGAQRLEELRQRPAPQLGRRIQPVTALAGGAGREQKPRRGARLGAEDVGLGDGNPAGGALHEPAAVRISVHGEAESAQPGGEGQRVVGGERAAQRRRSGGERRQEQGPVGDAL